MQMTIWEAAFQNLILNILKNYKSCTTIILLVADNLEIKRKILSDYQLKIANDNVKKLVPKFFDEEKFMLHYEKIATLFKNRIKSKSQGSECFYLERLFFKGTLSGLRQILAIESPLKMMKIAFNFALKARFVLKIFKFLS